MGFTSTRSKDFTRGRRGASSTPAGVSDPASRSRSPRSSGSYAASSPATDALRDQPADRHAGRRGARARPKFTVTTTHSTATPTSRRCGTAAAVPLEALAREKHVTYVKLDGEVGVLGNGAGLSMSRWTWSRRGRPPGELLRPRRRGRCPRRRGRALRDHARPPGEGDLLQHLRRHHALRRGRRGILQALTETDLPRPLVVRLDGTRGGRAAGPPRPRRRTSPSGRRRSRRRRPGAGAMSDLVARVQKRR